MPPALSQYVVDFDHRVDWDNVKMLKSEPYAYWFRVAESFLINQKTRSLNVTNRNDGANILLFVVCLQPTNNFLCILQHFLLVALPRAR